jgi:multidrug resistance efflux pump
MQIDDRIYRQRVHQAQAQLAMKIAALNNNIQQRKSAEAVIQRNEAALASAKAQNIQSQANLKRVKALSADGSLSVRERDAALASAAQGNASIAQAQATLDVSRQDLQTTIVNRGALEADVENAKAAWNWRTSTCKTPELSLRATASLDKLASDWGHMSLLVHI